MDIIGKTENLKRSVLEELNNLYDYVDESGSFIPREMVERISQITHQTGREVAVFLNRYGHVESVTVGDNHTAELPKLSSRRSALENEQGRLSGLRCIHTHPNGSVQPSSVDISSLKSLKLDAMIAVGIMSGGETGLMTGFSVTMLTRNPDTAILDGHETHTFHAFNNLRTDELWDNVALTDLSSSYFKAEDNPFIQKTEKAILAAVETALHNKEGSSAQLVDELEELANTAGLEVVKKVIQKRERPNAASYIGSGIAKELSLEVQSGNIDVVVFDDELSAAQVRNLEAMIGTKIIDRTALILDIFAARARTQEGKTQVELAQLKYRLPRLTGFGTMMDKIRAGVGARGPGEKKLEVDKRLIRKRISLLEKELLQLKKRRDINRSARKKANIPVVTIVGYTNAGKSTLLNTLCNSDVLAENKLFATLDPTTRSLALPGGKDILLTDTVGFIRKLPHDLVEAFSSTLEEAVYGDVILHIVDVSSKEADIQASVGLSLLQDLNALNKPVILVLNKCDLAPDPNTPHIINPFGPAVTISAVTGYGFDHLFEAIDRALPVLTKKIKLNIPYTEGWVAPYIHQYGKITSEEYTENGVTIQADMPITKCDKVSLFMVDN